MMDETKAHLSEETVDNGEMSVTHTQEDTVHRHSHSHSHSHRGHSSKKHKPTAKKTYKMPSSVQILLILTATIVLSVLFLCLAPSTVAISEQCVFNKWVAVAICLSCSCIGPILYLFSNRLFDSHRKKKAATVYKNMCKGVSCAGIVVLAVVCVVTTSIDAEMLKGDNSKEVSPDGYASVDRVTAFAPSPQLPADGSQTADFDAEHIGAQDIYAYMDALVAQFPNYITEETLGKDASGTYDWKRYVCSLRAYDAWQRTDYPPMYAWVNGSRVIYAESVSPRVGDTMYETGYIGSAYGKVTAVDNASQTRTVSGKVYTRDAAKDIKPTLVYTHSVYDPNHKEYWFFDEATTDVYDASKQKISQIAQYTGDTLTDEMGRQYIRYPLGDRDAQFATLPVIVIGSNEHGGQQKGDSAEPAIVTARMAKDLCANNYTDDSILSLLKNNYMVVFCPVINPYGFGKTDGYVNANGVNIDRNFDTPGWGKDSDTRHGEYGGSEVETQYFMNTLVESKAKYAMANHSLGYDIDDTGNPIYMGLCSYMLSAERDVYTPYIRHIRSVMSANYGLLLHPMGEAPPEIYAKTRSYMDWVGIKGVAVEMAVSDGTQVGSKGALHTAKILEADYTLALQFLNMLMVCDEE